MERSVRDGSPRSARSAWAVAGVAAATVGIGAIVGGFATRVRGTDRKTNGRLQSRCARVTAIPEPERVRPACRVLACA